MSTPPSGATPQPPAGPPVGYGGAPHGQPAPGAAATVPPPHPAPQGDLTPQDRVPDAYAAKTDAPRTGLHHALLAEWTKIRSVRSTVWTIAVMFVATVGIALLVAAGVSAADEQVQPTLPGAIGVTMGQIALLTLGVLVASTEYTTGMVRATFTACPARGRVLLAKSLVFAAIAFTTTAAALGLALWFTDLIQGETDYLMTSGDGATAVLGVALYVTLLGLLGVAFGFLLRSSAGAVTLMVAVVLLPAVVLPFLYMAESMRDLALVLDQFVATGAITALSISWSQTEVDYNGWPQTGVLAIVVITALTGAYLRLVQSDA